MSARNAADSCVYRQNAIVCIGDEPHPVYPPISAISGDPPFHPRCVHVLTPFVECLATEEERKRETSPPDLPNRSPAELQRRYRKGFQPYARSLGDTLARPHGSRNQTKVNGPRLRSTLVPR